MSVEICKPVGRWSPEAIKKARKARGWTQKDLAKRLGVSRRAVQYWEEGVATPQDPKALDRAFTVGSPTLETASEEQLLRRLVEIAGEPSALLPGSNRRVTTGKVLIDPIAGVTIEVPGD